MAWFLAILSGCSNPDGPADSPTWHADVAPLLADRCGSCHVAGGIAPFSIADYAEAEPWGEAIVDSIESGRMPPFYAVESDECEERLGWQADLRLSNDEKAMLGDWVDAGKPEGDPDDAAPAPLRPAIHLENPNLEVQLQTPFEVSGDRDIYQCFRIELDHTSDIWIQGVEVLVDNDAVVHHVLVWNDPNDQSAALAGPDGSYPCSGQPDVWPTELLSAWAPGGPPARSPTGSGSLVHPGASLVVNIHYHPTGTTTEHDQTSFALQTTDLQPANHTTWYLVDLPFGAEVQPGPNDAGGPEFRIPPGVSDHTETVSLTIPDELGLDLPVFAIAPHMHYLGREMLVTIRRPGGDDECLIHTPGFRFDFQSGYYYDTSNGALPVVHSGDTVEVRCTYDNSDSNPFLGLQLDAAGIPAPADVWWGEDTGSEMCMAMIGITLPPVDWLALF